MAERWALAPAEDGGVELAPLGPDGLPAGPVLRETDLASAVRGRPEVSRWVWRSTAEVYPRLLATGVRVERCYDVEDAETLLLGHEGRYGEPRSAAAALARLRGGPVPPDPPQRSAAPGAQSPLFEPEAVRLPLADLVEVYAEQQRRHDRAGHPERMRLAAEHGLPIVAVDPAYTSMWGDEHWCKPLTSKKRKMSRHDAAGIAIGRRALGHPIRRRTAPPHDDRSDRRGHRTAQAGPGARGREGTRPPVTERAHDARRRIGAQRTREPSASNTVRDARSSGSRHQMPPLDTV